MNTEDYQSGDQQAQTERLEPETSERAGQNAPVAGLPTLPNLKKEVGEVLSPEKSEVADDFLEKLASESEEIGLSHFSETIDEIEKLNALNPKTIDLGAEKEYMERFAEEFEEEVLPMINPEYRAAVKGYFKDGMMKEFWENDIKLWIKDEMRLDYIDENWRDIEDFMENAKGLKLEKVIKEKLERIHKMLDDLMQSEFPAELLLRVVIAIVFAKMMEEANAQKKGILGMFKSGAGKITLKDAAKAVLNPEYARKPVSEGSEWTHQQKLLDGIKTEHGEKSLKIKIPKKNLDANDKAGSLATVVQGEFLRGQNSELNEVKEVKTEGLEQFVKINKLRSEFEKVVTEDLKPILGKKLFVSKVIFHSQPSPDGELGSYLNGEINIYSSPEYEGNEALYLQVLLHEMGHALEPEKMLPLKDAILYSMAMRMSLEDYSGPATSYSGQAESYYAGRIGFEAINKFKESIGAENLERLMEGNSRWEHIQRSPASEDWAESVALALLWETFPEFFPEKPVIVAENLKKLGIDFEQLAKKLRGRIV